jgi:glycosyltransferase involved in cell wall biosynthesis
MAYKTLSIVIPVYNEEKYIATTLKRVLDANCFHLSKEIIIIDDGSQDNTSSVIKSFISKEKQSLKNTNNSILLIKKVKNEGKGSAIKEGFIKATGDIVLIQDADLEYLPEEFPLLLEPFIIDKADVVYGSRFISNRPHRVLYYWHSVANMLLTTLSNIFTNLNLTDMETGYKVFTASVIREIAPKLQSTRFGFEPEITARIAKIKNIKIFEVGISYYGRTYNEGKKIGWVDGVRAIWEIIKYNLLVK